MKQQIHVHRSQFQMAIHSTYYWKPSFKANLVRILTIRVFVLNFFKVIVDSPHRNLELMYFKLVHSRLEKVQSTECLFLLCYVPSYNITVMSILLTLEKTSYQVGITRS